MTGSDTWKSLLAEALTAIDSLPSRPPWTLGGGTVLALRLGHRLSRDIDVFITDPQLITHLSPRLNQAVAGQTDSYDESSTFLKLRFELGEVDFIVAPSLLGMPSEQRTLLGHNVMLEPNEEILAKKLFYRVVGLKVRDLYDLAAAQRADPSTVARIAPLLSRKRELLSRRIEALAPSLDARLAAEVVPVSGYELGAGEIIAAARALIASIPAGEP